MKKEIVDLTKDHWQNYYGRELSNSEAEEMIRNVSEYFDILDSWDKQEKGEKDHEKALTPMKEGGVSHIQRV